MTFADDLAAAQAPTDRFHDVRVQIGTRTHTLRYRPMLGTDYAAETLKHPPRLGDDGVQLDKEYGYNLSTLAPAISPLCAKRLEAGSEVPLSSEQWTQLFAVIDGGAAQAIQNAVFMLNEFATEQAVKAAKKVLDGSAKI